MKQYEKACDIESLINVTLNQRILIATLLNKVRAAMFMNQRKRALLINSSGSSASD